MLEHGFYDSKLKEYIIIDRKLMMTIEVTLKIPWLIHSQVNGLSASLN